MDPNNMKLPKPLDSRSGPQVKHNRPIHNALRSWVPFIGVQKNKNIVCSTGVWRGEIATVLFTLVKTQQHNRRTDIHGEEWTYLILEALIPALPVRAECNVLSIMCAYSWDYR